MLGAITGDTVGSAYEFCNTKDYNFTLFLGNSAYTDDSIMTMAVAYWLLKDKEHTYQGLEDIMVEFGHKCPCPMGGYGGGFHTWLFFPDGLYNYDDKYGEAPYESNTGRHPIYDWESSCQGTVPQAIIAFLDSESFEDAIRKAVSLGGDSDTLACITGGIAEAFYKEIPKSMADRVARSFPVVFNKILDAVREETVYGKTCKIVEG